MHTYQNRDRGFLEYFGPQGLATELYRRSRDLTSLPLGFVFRRLFILLGSLSLLLVFIGSWNDFLVMNEASLIISLGIFFFS